jgi:hypothetical protein
LHYENKRYPFPGKHLAELFETLESGQLQALISSGLLTDLRRCAAELDPTKVNRDEFQRILGLDPTVFRVKMGGPKNTDQITQEWREAGFYVNDYLTQANFPLTARETTEDTEIEIIDPGCSFSEEEGLKFLEAAGLERLTYEHALRFAEQCGRTTTGKKPYIVFLHEPWLAPDRYRRFVCVRRRPGDRRLYVYCPVIRFSDDCVLAGVRRRKQPQS